MKKKLKLQPNPFKEGLDGRGRPRRYEDTDEDVERFNNRIIEYFDYIQGEATEDEDNLNPLTGVPMVEWKRYPEPASINGLALFVGFNSKDTLYQYGKKLLYSDSVKRARALIEKHYETGLSGKAPTGAIFALKNFGWKDKQEVEQTVSKKITITPRQKINTDED